MYFPYQINNIYVLTSTNWCTKVLIFNPQIYIFSSQKYTNVIDAVSQMYQCTAMAHLVAHTNVPMRWQSNGCHIMHARSTPWLVPRGSKHCVVTVSENRQDSYLRISTISSNIRSLLHTLCTLSDHRWRAFFQNSLFTWSSFHVYGSLLSNQIEASNAHKNWIVWHLSLKTNICMENQHRCLVVCFIARRCKKRMYESRSYDVT